MRKCNGISMDLLAQLASGLAAAGSVKFFCIINGVVSPGQHSYRLSNF